jgi:hypothetical protein
MIIAFLNIISWTSIISQLFLVTLYSLGIIFYKFNKSVTQGINEELNTLNSNESVEYFSEVVTNNNPKKDSDFENFDDYSAFSKDKNIDVNGSELTAEITQNEPEYVEQTPKIIEEKGTTESVENLEEDYVLQNATLTATVEEEDFEQITFGLQSEQENSITMADEEDIKRVFQSNDWTVRHQKTNH